MTQRFEPAIYFAQVTAINIEMISDIRNFHLSVALARGWPLQPPFVKGQDTTVGHWLNRYIQCWDRLEAINGMTFAITLPVLSGIQWHTTGEGFEEPRRCLNNPD